VQKEMKKNTTITIIIIATAIVIAILIGIAIIPIFCDNESQNNTQTPTENTTTQQADPTQPSSDEDERLAGLYLPTLVPTNKNAAPCPLNENVLPIKSDYFKTINGITASYQFAPSDSYKANERKDDSIILTVKTSWDEIKSWPISYISNALGTRSVHIASDDISGTIIFSNTLKDDDTIGNALLEGHWIYTTTTINLDANKLFENPQQNCAQELVNLWGNPTSVQSLGIAMNMYTCMLTYITDDCAVNITMYEKVSANHDIGIANIMIGGQGSIESE
jgi:hypothetical protein